MTCPVCDGSREADGDICMRCHGDGSVVQIGDHARTKHPYRWLREAIFAVVDDRHQHMTDSLEHQLQLTANALELAYEDEIVARLRLGEVAG